MAERANTASGKPNEIPSGKSGAKEAAKLSRDSHGLQFRIGETKAQKARPARIKV
jgi:hypothetical protein